ncbi:MAG: S-layer homology domain-containing protein, partial [Caryophanon sp.]|nr:S-layer homology domain-containing protein [Caryophanon sp.]
MSKNSKNRLLKATVAAAVVTSAVPLSTIPVFAANFSDVDESNTHYTAITELAKRGIIQGFEDKTFRTDTAVTRGQAAKILTNILGLNIHDSNSKTFTDVPESNYYYPYISALANAGIINGFEDGSFKPNDTITRGQMAKMIALGFDLQLSNEASPFEDVPTTHEYAPYIQALYTHSITTGKTATTYDMKNVVTRGQLASFVIRAEKQTKQAEQITGTIDDITTSSITIDDENYNVANFPFLQHVNNKEALVNASITFTATNNEVNAISSLTLANTVSSFDGQESFIEELIVPASIEKVENMSINALTIERSTSDLTLAKIDAQNVNVTAKQNVTASTKALAAPTPALNFSHSTIQNVFLNMAKAKISKISSSINVLEIIDKADIELHGDFKQVAFRGDASLTGNARIDELLFAGTPTNIERFKQFGVKHLSFNNKRLSFLDAIAQMQQQNATPVLPSIPNPNNNGVQSGGNGSANNESGTTPPANETQNSNNTPSVEDDQNTTTESDGTSNVEQQPTPPNNENSAESGNAGDNANNGSGSTTEDNSSVDTDNSINEENNDSNEANENNSSENDNTNIEAPSVPDTDEDDSTNENAESPSSPDIDEEQPNKEIETAPETGEELTEENTETPSIPETDEEESTEEIQTPSSPETDEEELTEENTQSPSSPETDEEELTEEIQTPSIPEIDEEESTEEITESPSSPEIDDEELTEENTETPSSPEIDDEELTEENTDTPSSPETDEEESTEEITESPSSPEIDDEELTEENTDTPSSPETDEEEPAEEITE